MKCKKAMVTNARAQAMVEYLLLTMVVIFAVMVFVFDSGVPKEAVNMILQDPIYMIHAGANQIRLN